MAETEGSGASRAGGEEFHNEDALLVEDGIGLYVVCDGVSGRPAGEVAAGVAVESLEQFVSRVGDGFGDVLDRDPHPTEFAARALRHALGTIVRAGADHPELAGMTTTITMLLVRRGHGVVGHSGDSRLYLARRGRLQQLTRDHELTEELKAAGAGEAESEVAVDTFAIDLRPGDTYILCTDGVEAVLDEDHLSRNAFELPPHVLASRIVSAAHRQNPDVDATVVVVRVRQEHEPAWLSLSTLPNGTSFGHVIPVAGRGASA